MSSGELTFHSISDDYEAQLKLKEIEIDWLKAELNVMMNSEIERLQDVV